MLVRPVWLAERQAEPVWLVSLVQSWAKPVWLVQRKVRLVKRRGKADWLVEPVWLIKRRVKPVWQVEPVRLVGHGSILQAGSAILKNWQLVLLHE